MEITRNKRKQKKLSTIVFRNTFVRNRRASGQETIAQFDVTKLQQTSMHEKLSTHWDVDNFDKVCADLPRLVSRVTVRRGGDKKILWEPSLTEGGEDSPTRDLVVSLIKFLISRMEQEDIANKLFEEIDEALKSSSSSPEDVGYLQSLLRIIGSNSRTFRILKCIHQDYVLIATTDLKLSLTKDKLTKDVRGDDGWQITITIAEFIQVVHTRKEQSMDLPGKENNHFEFAYAISMTFDKNMEEMTAAQLKIRELHLGPEMDDNVKTEIQKLFANGNLIVQ